MYATKVFEGTDDIALVKTKERVVFIPGTIMPVSFKAITSSLIFSKLFSQICLSKVKDVKTPAYVSGFGASGAYSIAGLYFCWTNSKGPSIYQR